MGKSKEIRKRTLLERLAAERAAALKREKILSMAVNKLRAALIEYAKGENWAEKKPGHILWSWNKTDLRNDIVWVGEGRPDLLAKAVIASVFGKDHPLTGEVVQERGDLGQKKEV